MTQKSAIARIEKAGLLLVFPVANKKEPKSLWSEFYPKSKMKWEWDDDGDGRVFKLWALMKTLSKNTEVVYSKWYQGRATFFSRELFRAMLTLLQRQGMQGVTGAAAQILGELENSSPLSTRDIKKLTELQGRLNEPVYNRAMKTLFNRLLIVGFGEVDDGAFPSLAVGATQLLYEDLWNEAAEVPVDQAKEVLNRFMPPGSSLRKFWDRQLQHYTKESNP